MTSGTTYTCNFVVVYTDNSVTPATQHTITLTNNDSKVLPSNITINSVTNFGNSNCVLNSTCGTLPSATQAVCYGVLVQLNSTNATDGGGGSHTNSRYLTHLGIIINGIEYLYSTPWETSYGSGPGVPWATSTTDTGLTGTGDITSLKTRITDIVKVNDIIPKIIACQTENDNGDQGRQYMYQFKSVPGLETNSFLKCVYSRDSGQSGAPTIVYLPIKLRTDLDYVASDNCPCLL